MWGSPATTREKRGAPLDTGHHSLHDAFVRYFPYEWTAGHEGEGCLPGKQAKIISPAQEKALLGYLATTRYPARDRVMFLLSMKAGLRAKAIASLTWAMVTDAQGQVADALQWPNLASKGPTGGRIIPLHPDLQAALVALQTARGAMATAERSVLFSERGGGLSAATVRLWFHRRYTALQMDDCSAHSGRRTFMTRATRHVSQVGAACATCRSWRDTPAWP